MACRGVDAEAPDPIACGHRVHRLRTSRDQTARQNQCCVVPRRRCRKIAQCLGDRVGLEAVPKRPESIQMAPTTASQRNVSDAVVSCMSTVTIRLACCS